MTPGSVAAQYLDHRSCIVPPGDLRWHPAVPYNIQGKRDPIHVGPPLVALVTDIHDGTPISIHKTWITPTGKADLGEHMPRKLLWNHRSDGVIRLWPNDELTLGLTIGEGIETCLAAALAGMGHALRAQPRRVSGAARIRGADGPRDHDKRNPKTGKRPGIDAARAVIGRYAEAGFDPERDIQVLMPETEGHDAADLELA